MVFSLSALDILPIFKRSKSPTCTHIMLSRNLVLISLLLVGNVQSSSLCHPNEYEIVCRSLNFSHHNASSTDHLEFIAIHTLHLTNVYYSGPLPNHLTKLIIDDYPNPLFASPFSSSLTSLEIEHSALSEFPNWLCTFNSDLSLIEIDYSHLEDILDHDLHLCLNLLTLRITHSNLKHFSSTSSHPHPSLLSLYLYGNQFSTLSSDTGLNLRPFTRLRLLNLSHNQLKFISSEQFRPCPNLTKLDLSFAHVELLSIPSLNYFNSLQDLDLRGNDQLQITPNWYEYLPRLTKIHFPYAHFCCDYTSNFNVFNDKRTRRSPLNERSNASIGTRRRRLANEKMSYMVTFQSNQVCFPSPDPMTPCESLFSSKFIRGLFLAIVLVSVMSNVSAVIINLVRLITLSYNRWAVSTILCLNLALADFLSSIYLILVGLIDLRFQDNFHNQTQLWTNSHLCTLAGFMYIFGIQSSIYALALLTFERFYTILFSFKRQTPWPQKFTLTSILLGWLISLAFASLPLLNVNDFHANSLCVPFRIETSFDRLYLSLLIILDICFIGIIITCNGLICFNFSKSHVHTSNDARATLKILTLVVAICISRIPLVIFIFLALILHPTYSSHRHNSSLRFHDIKLAILFLQPFSACFNPFMYSSLSILKWAKINTARKPKHTSASIEFARFRSQSDRGYHPLHMTSISSLDYRTSSLPNTP